MKKPGNYMATFFSHRYSLLSYMNETTLRDILLNQEFLLHGTGQAAEIS
jgi:hypothetical protein